EVKRADERVRTAALFHRGWRRPVVPVKQILARASACRADEISLHVLLLSRRVVEALHERGFQVVTWTADNPFWLRRARSLGLRAVITNRPAELRAALESL
ncbi:MAG TPA: glycerophosphodiester phosphodiesterase family protein, partial [Pyrinomonadaceae bacterium]|nr:glycerophosphodiester phosphodiesterase family protein [Pyrinomonadaceae bacterium]